MTASIWVKEVPGRSLPSLSAPRREVAQLSPQHCCLQSGTLVDTPAGRQPVNCLRLGDHVWGFERRARVPALILKICRDEQAPAPLRGRRLHPTVTVAESVWLFWQDQWMPAAQTGLPEVALEGPIYDLSTDTGNYFCNGMLLSHHDDAQS